MIGSAADMVVVGEAADGAEAVRLAHELRPDVVLMDIRMPGMDGLAATEAITRDASLDNAHILILTTFEADDYVLSALRAGASGFLGEGVEPVEDLDAIRIIAAGDSLLSPAATKALIARYLAQPEPGRPDAVATNSMLSLNVSAKSSPSRRRVEVDPAIAEKLFLSPLTAKTTSTGP